MKIGVIADTHGYLHPNVFRAFEGMELILHAGDIGTEDIITSLESIAPVRAIHGNIDIFPLSTRYPEALALEIHGVGICMIHLFISVRTSPVQNALRNLHIGKLELVICGHTHEAKLERKEEVLIFNPGSAGRRRFSLRQAVGIITISDDGRFVPEIIYLEK
ncbi:MAG TPA: metallophosphoesterase family protein [bacterium]